MVDDVKSMPKWFWWIAAAVAAYGVYAYLKAKAAGATSSTASEVQAVSQAAGVAPVSSGSSVDLSGVTSGITGIQSSVNALPASITATIAQAVAGLGAGMTQMETDIHGYMAQQTQAINTGFGAMANQIDTGFAANLKQFASLSTLINNENATIANLQQSVTSSTSNEAVLAGLEAFNAVKNQLGGLNTTNDAIAKAAPSCVTGSGNDAKIDFQCLGQLILSGKIDPTHISG